MKFCTACKKTLADTCFRPDLRLRSKLSSACRPCINERARRYRKNPKAQARIKAYMKSWLSKHAHSNSLTHKRWLDANKLRCKAHSCNNIAKRRFGVSPIPTDSILRLIEASASCYYCGSLERLGFDHRIPLFLGGKHDLSNLVVCCARCNQLKGKLSEARFRHKCASLGIPLI